MTKTFDLVVLGTGTAASTVATTCREAGWSVAIVDSRPYGGTCALRGCDPKKVLVGAAETLDALGRLHGKGVAAEGAHLHWPDLIRFKRTFTEPVPERRQTSFADAGIATFHGRARFVGPRSVRVGDEALEGRYLLVATGARPMDLPIRGQELLTTSDQFLELDRLPARIVFLGSGFISFEFAHVAATAGAEVTMLEMLERPLAGFDPDLVAMLVERTRKMRIDLRLETRVDAIEKQDDRLTVRATTRGRAVNFDADMVVHGAGRVPEIDDLDLTTAGVEFDARTGVRVNAYMQSVSNPAVYAAGDAAAGGLPLTPVAGLEARVAAANLLEGNRTKVEYPPTPSVVFTLPPLASVGLQESEARAKGLRFRTNHARTSSWYSSRRVGEEHSGYKVLVEEDTGLILGAHLLGPHAEELINLFTLAMGCGLTSRDIKETVFAYPTHGSDMAYMV
jgi:glutathione reductase (NADPH)